MKREIDEQVEWASVLLGDEQYFQLATGGTPSTEKKDFWEDGTIPWLSSGEVHKKVIRDADGRITEKGYRYSNARFYPQGSLLIALAGQGKTRGTVAITEIEATSNQSIAAIIPSKSKVAPYFAYYNLDSRYEELRSISAGAGRAGLSLSILANVAIQLPNIDEQQAIASVLLKIDQAIEQTKVLIAKQQRIKAGLMHDLLTKGIDEHGNIRSEATHEFKDSPLGRIPEEWVVSGIKEKADPARPYLRTGPFGSSLKGRDWVEEGVPVVTIGSLGVGHFIHSELLYITNAKARTLQAYVLEPGDVVFSRVADVGRSVEITEAESGWVMSSNLMRISLNREHVVPKFIYLSIVYNHKTREQIRRSVNASGREVANGEVINSLLFAWPKPEEQGRITKALGRLESSNQTERANLAKLIKIKAGLMQDLLTGKVPVTALLETPPRTTHI